MISVIIPHHKEDGVMMTPLMSSLNSQVGVNWNDVEVIVVNDDKEHELTADSLGAYANIQSRVRSFFNGKTGYMGVSRQIGIDNANGDYLIFCDADDALYSVTVLYDLMARKGADVYSYKFLEQNGENRWIEHQPQFTWMFAKSYRKSFIQEHDIRFHDDLLWHEDTYFNQVLLAYSPRVEILGYAGYVWLYSPDTITRRNNAEYTSKSMCMYIDSLDARLDRIRYVIPKDTYKTHVLNDIVYIYCVLQNETQKDMLDTVRQDIEKRLTEYIRKRDPELSCLSADVKRTVTSRIRGCMDNMLIIPNEGFEAFIRRVTAQV